VGSRMSSSFSEQLRRGRPLLMDGAMGSELIRTGLPPGENGARWNLTQPEAVLDTHRGYVAAGAEVVLTNTFQANPRAIPDSGELQRMGAAAVGLARQARAKFVLGDIGPLESAEDLQPTVTALAGADGILLETFSSPEALNFVESMRRRPETRDIPVLLSLTYLRSENGIETLSRHTPEWFAERAKDAGVIALGVNCGREISIADCAEILQRYRTAADLPLFARPNAGTPVRSGKQWAYPRSLKDFAAGVKGLLAAGATMIGGCCGTTPEYIAAMRAEMDRQKEPGA
jgi:5-methyltetrahydrofolate--homocysteine methyltransferase